MASLHAIHAATRHRVPSPARNRTRTNAQSEQPAGAPKAARGVDCGTRWDVRMQHTGFSAVRRSVGVDLKSALARSAPKPKRKWPASRTGHRRLMRRIRNWILQPEWYTQRNQSRNAQAPIHVRNSVIVTPLGTNPDGMGPGLQRITGCHLNYRETGPGLQFSMPPTSRFPRPNPTDGLDRELNRGSKQCVL